MSALTEYRPGDSPYDLVAKILRKLDGAPRPADTGSMLWRKILTQLGGVSRPADSIFDTLVKIHAVLSPDTFCTCGDTLRDLLRKILELLSPGALRAGDGIFRLLQKILDAIAPVVVPPVVVDPKYVLPLFTTTATSPAASSVLYFGFLTVPSVTYDPVKIVIPIAGVIQRLDVKVNVAGILASAELVDFYARLNDTTDVGPVSFTNDAAHTSGFAVVSQAVVAGDFIAAKIVTPAWSVSPTTVRYWMTVVINTAI